MPDSINIHAAYISAAPSLGRPILEQIQAMVQTLVPDAEPSIGYKMPAFRLPSERGGNIFFYFAAFKNHIGIFPPVADAALREELAPYAGPKWNLSFQYDAPIPYELIGRVALALAAEYTKPPKQ